MVQTNSLEINYGRPVIKYFFCLCMPNDELRKSQLTVAMGNRGRIC